MPVDEKSPDPMRALLGEAAADRIESRNTRFPDWGRWSREVLFGDLWQRVQLSPAERSLVTVAVLAALGRERELEIHIDVAFRNGLSEEQIAEALYQAGFYAGWPAAGMGLNCLVRREPQADIT